MSATLVERALLENALVRLDDLTLKLCLSTTIDRDERHEVLQDVTAIEGNLKTAMRLRRQRRARRAA